MQTPSLGSNPIPADVATKLALRAAKINYEQKEDTRMTNAVKQQILQRLLPIFTPSDETETSNHCCIYCKDRFSLESSLLWHINRESVKIVFTCKLCNDVLIFTNRCKLLAHMVSHAPICQEFKIDDIKIYPLCVDVPGSVTMLASESLALSSNDVSTNSSPQLTLTPSPAASENILTEPDNVSPALNSMSETLNAISADRGLSCHECFIKFQTKSQQFTHFTKQDNANISCGGCSLMMSNKCALRAHQRIHFDAPPYICPECGVQFLSSSQLKLHATYICTHLARSMYAECESCKRLIKCVEMLQHMRLEHVSCVYRCKLCPHTSHKESGLKLHHTLSHAGTAYVAADLYYRCWACPTLLIAPARLDQHLPNHIGGPKSPMFECPGCEILFTHKNALKKHTVECLKHRESLNSALASDHKDKVIRETNLGKQLTKCKYCSKTFFFHLKALEENLTIRCPYCNISGKIIDAPPEHSTDSETMNSQFKTQHKNINLMNLKPVLRRLEEDVNLQTEKNTHKLKSPKKRKAVKRKSSEAPLPFETGITVSEVDAVNDGSFSCSKCSFTTADKSEYQQHIVVHRDVSTAYQCMECGLCFAVKPSFATHLFVSHKISDVDDYILKNNCYDEQAIREFEEDSVMPVPHRRHTILEQFQCSICLEKCNNQSDFDKHFRVHGMAFLMKKQKNK